MKKNLLIFAGIAAIAAVSCTKEATDSKEAGQKMVPLTITIGNNVEASTDTKAKYSDRLGIRWDKENDKATMGLVYSSDDGFKEDEERGSVFTHPSEIAVGEDLAATISATIPEETKYLAWYLNADAGNKTPQFNWPAAVTQTKAGIVENLKLYSQVHELSLEGGQFRITGKARLAGALIRVRVYSTKGSVEKVKSVRLHANTGILGGGWFNFIKHNHIGAQGNELTVSLTESYDLSGINGAASSNGIYLPIFIGGNSGENCETTSEGVTYTVTMESGSVYVFTTEKTRTWKSGTLHEELLNIDKATSKKIVTPGEETFKTIRYTGLGEGGFNNFTWKNDDIKVGDNQEVNWIAKTIDSGAASDDGKDQGIFSKYLKFNYEWTPSDDKDWIEFFIQDGNHIRYNCKSAAGQNRSVIVKVTFDAETAKADGYVIDESQKDVIYRLEVSQKWQYAELSAIFVRWMDDTMYLGRVFSQTVSQAAGSGRTDSINFTGIERSDFNTKLTAESTEGWLTIGEWNATDGYINYTFTANSTGTERKARILVKVKQETANLYKKVVPAEENGDDPLTLCIMDIIQPAQ